MMNSISGSILINIHLHVLAYTYMVNVGKGRHLGIAVIVVIKYCSLLPCTLRRTKCIVTLSAVSVQPVWAPS